MSIPAILQSKVVGKVSGEWISLANPRIAVLGLILLLRIPLFLSLSVFSGSGTRPKVIFMALGISSVLGCLLSFAIRRIALSVKIEVAVLLVICCECLIYSSSRIETLPVLTVLTALDALLVTCVGAILTRSRLAKLILISLQILILITVTAAMQLRVLAVILALASIIVVLLTLGARVIINPILEFVWVYLFFSIRGYMIKTYYATVPLSEYLRDRQFESSGVVLDQCLVELSTEKSPTTGYATRFDYAASNKLASLRTLNRAACELYERMVAQDHRVEGRNVISNGFAAYTTIEESQKRSILELIERDSVLAHYYTSRPPLMRYDLKRLTSEQSTDPEIAAIARVCQVLKRAELYRLYSPIDRIGVFWLTVDTGEIVTYGWAASDDFGRRILTSAFAEAISAIRIVSTPRIAEYISQYRQGSFPNITRSNFREMTSALEISGSDLQVILVLGSDPMGKRISFLQDCPLVNSMEEILTPTISCDWYPQAVIQTITVEKEELGVPLYVSKSSSDSVYHIDWPSVSEDEIKAVSLRKGIPLGNLSANHQAPCIVY